MYCYNCGTDCNEDRFCSNCGCRVGKPEERAEIYPAPPLGVYEGENDSFVEICPDSIRICWVKLVGPYSHVRYERSVKFCDLKQVQLLKVFPNNGALFAFREKGNPTPITDSKDEQTCGPNSLLFRTKMLDKFRVAYEFLQKCCEINMQQVN